MKPHHLPLIVLTAGLCLALSSCGPGDSPPPPPPTALDQSSSDPENLTLSDSLAADNVDYSTSDFFVTTAAENGTITLDPDSGDFTYAPEFGFLGTDSFYWQVSDQYGYSNIGLYTIDVGGTVVRGRIERSTIASR